MDDENENDEELARQLSLQTRSALLSDAARLIERGQMNAEQAVNHLQSLASLYSKAQEFRCVGPQPSDEHLDWLYYIMQNTGLNNACFSEAQTIQLNPNVLSNPTFGQPSALDLRTFEEKRCAKKQFVVRQLFWENLASKRKHQNVVIIDDKNHTIERFEPNGSSTSFLFDYTVDDNYLDQLVSDVFSQYRHNYEYIPPIQYCPRIGVQGREGRSKKDPCAGNAGFCVTWSLIYAHARFLAPDEHQSVLVNRLLALGPKQLFDLALRYTTMINTELRDKNYTQWLAGKKRATLRTLAYLFKDKERLNDWKLLEKLIGDVLTTAKEDSARARATGDTSISSTENALISNAIVQLYAVHDSILFDDIQQKREMFDALSNTIYNVLGRKDTSTLSTYLGVYFGKLVASGYRYRLDPLEDMFAFALVFDLKDSDLAHALVSNPTLFDVPNVSKEIDRISRNFFKTRRMNAKNYPLTLQVLDEAKRKNR